MTHSGFAMMIYQLVLYPSLQKACGPVNLARITGVIFHFHPIWKLLRLWFNILIFVYLTRYLGIVHTTLAKLPLHDTAVWLHTLPCVKYCFHSEVPYVCKWRYLSLFLYILCRFMSASDWYWGCTSFFILFFLPNLGDNINWFIPSAK